MDLRALADRRACAAVGRSRTPGIAAVARRRRCGGPGVGGAAKGRCARHHRFDAGVHRRQQGCGEIVRDKVAGGTAAHPVGARTCGDMCGGCGNRRHRLVEPRPVEGASLRDSECEWPSRRLEERALKPKIPLQGMHSLPSHDRCAGRKFHDGLSGSPRPRQRASTAQRHNRKSLCRLEL